MGGHLALLLVKRMAVRLPSGVASAEGGRTGLANVVTAVLMLLAVFFAPLAQLVGGGVDVAGGTKLYPVTAAALMTIGYLMFGGAAELDSERHDSHSCGYNRREDPMPFASVAEVKNRLSEYLAQARRSRKPIVVTRHGKPYALIQAITDRDIEDLMWSRLAERRLREAWKGEDDAFYDYL